MSNPNKQSRTKEILGLTALAAVIGALAVNSLDRLRSTDRPITKTHVEQIYSDSQTGHYGGETSINMPDSLKPTP